MQYLSYHRVLSVACRIWLVCLLVSQPAFAEKELDAGERAVWSALKSNGHFALLRHAMAPGTGDPEQFALGDCSTQRILSREGQDQAVAIGEQFRANGLDEVIVYSSQWCRCLETANLLALGPVQELPALNSFYRRSERRTLQTQLLRGWLREQKPSVPRLLVTHQVNITELTGVYPASGEMVVVHQSKAGELTVVGRIQM